MYVLGLQSKYVDVFDPSIHMMCAIQFDFDHATILYKQFEGDVIFSFWMLDHESFQFEATNDAENSMLEDLGNSKIYDKLWLFEKNVYFSKFLHNIIFTSNNKESIQTKWCWDLSCECNLLFRKDSYFSQPMNGFV